MEDKKKKGKKVSKACKSCKKLHRKCDEKRPCERCVKYGRKCEDTPKRIPIFLDSVPVKKYFLQENNNNNIHINNNNYNNNNLINNSNNKEFQNAFPFHQNMMQMNLNLLNHCNHNNFNFTPYQTNKEMEMLKSEINNLQKELEKIEKMNLPENIDQLDPIELFFLQQQYFPTIPDNLMQENKERAGSLYFAANFRTNLNNEEFNSKNLIISHVSENFALAYGLTPQDMLGKEYYSFSPQYSEDKLIKFSKVYFMRKSKKKKKKYRKKFEKKKKKISF